MKELYTKVWAALREMNKGQWCTLELVIVGAVISLDLKRQGKKASGGDGGRAVAEGLCWRNIANCKLLLD